MVRPALRSRTPRRVFRKGPGGKTTIHYKNRKPGKVSCASCGISLKGVVQTTRGTKGIPKSQRRPSRPYGGNLCGVCMRSLMIEKARAAVSQ